MLLLDEPLGALDRPLHDRLVRDLGALFARLGQTTLYVTHDVAEAFALGHRVAVIRDGRIAQVATPEELWSAPANAWVARFIGLANVDERAGDDGHHAAGGSQARAGPLWRRRGRIEPPRRAARHPGGPVRGRPPDRLRACRPRPVEPGERVRVEIDAERSARCRRNREHADRDGGPASGSLVVTLSLTPRPRAAHRDLGRKRAVSALRYAHAILGADDPVEERVEHLVLLRVVGAECRSLPLHDRRHARAHHGDAMALPGAGGPDHARRVARRGHLGDEAVTEGAVAAVRHLAGVVFPARAEDRVEGVDVEEPRMRVATLRGRGLVAEHRIALVGEPPEQALPGASVGPVRRDLEQRELAAPMRDVELERGLLWLERLDATHRQAALPALQCPVGAVRRLAGVHEPDERRAVVGAAAVLELPPRLAAVLLPAPRVVVPELALRLVRVRLDRVDRTPDVDVPNARHARSGT